MSLIKINQLAVTDKDKAVQQIRMALTLLKKGVVIA